MCNTEPRQRNLIIIFAVKSCVSDVISRLKTSYEASFFPSLHIRAIPTINFRQVTIFTQVGRFFQNVCILSLSVNCVSWRSNTKEASKICINVVFGRSHIILLSDVINFCGLLLAYLFFLNLITSSIHSFCFLYSFCR